MQQRPNTKRFMVHEVEDDSGDLAADLLTRLQELFADPAYDPPLLPAAALEVMNLARATEADFNAISAQLESDPLLAARVLRTANSVMFNNGARIESIKSALVRLGVGAVRNLVLQEAMSMRVFRSRVYRAEAEAVQRHCLATAISARAVARFTPLSPEYMYMVGLLHDVGFVVGFGALESILGPSEADRAPSAAYWPALHSVHEEVNQIVCTRWKLDPEITMLLGAHHSISIGGMEHPVLCTLALAESMADAAGFGVTRPGGRRYIIDGTVDRPDHHDVAQLSRSGPALGLTETQLKAASEAVTNKLAEAFG